MKPVVLVMRRERPRPKVYQLMPVPCLKIEGWNERVGKWVRA